MKSRFFLGLTLTIMGSAALAQTTSLNLTGWPYEVDTVNANLERFKEQTGIDASFSPFPSDNYHDRMVSDLMGGSKFDVVYVRDSFLSEWVSAGWIQPIDGFEGLEQYTENLPEAIINQMSVDGKLYGLPYYSGTNVFAYNSTHLKEAGIENPPTTWEELLEQARAVKEAGVTEHPIILQLKTGDYVVNTLEVVIAGFGGTLFDENLEPTFLEADSPAQKAVAWIQQGLNDGLIDEASLSSDDHDVTQALASGTHTFAIVADYNLNTINDPEKSQQAGKVTNALIPGDGDVTSGTTSYIRLYAITTETQDPEAAWKLVQFLGGKDATGEYYVPKLWALDFGLGFAYDSLYEDTDIRKSLEGWINPDILSEQTKYAVDRSYRFTPFFVDWQTASLGDIQNLVRGAAGDETFETLATSWQDTKAAYGY